MGHYFWLIPYFSTTVTESEMRSVASGEKTDVNRLMVIPDQPR